MPKIFEIFGYPLKDRSKEAEECRMAAMCPFSCVDCDGGGNRYLSNVKTEGNERLKKYFRGKKEVPSGICSIQMKDGEEPWVVCPRRLLTFGKTPGKKVKYQEAVHSLLLHHTKYPAGTKVGVWSEVKVQASTTIEGIPKSFDYTLDYVLVPLQRVSSHNAEKLSGMNWKKLKPQMATMGHTILVKDGVEFVDDFPAGVPTIIEIMTSSTSGGNKTKRTTIPQSFEDAINEKEHIAPGINYRQVWARMASQLIVKSEVGVEWGGHTIWVLQKNLVDNISNSTALDIRHFIADRLSEVNIMSFSYGHDFNRSKGVIPLSHGVLYSGPIGPASSKGGSFQDIVRSPYNPPLQSLVKLLVGKPSVNVIFIG
ncbi:MAG: hypothetical protein WC588_00090 [Candidatus Micrarchaeia archaeon]